VVIPRVLAAASTLFLVTLIPVGDAAGFATTATLSRRETISFIS